MYVKITRSGKRQYLQLVEAVRENGKPRQRHIATLGRLDQLLDSDVDALINGLLKATGRAPVGAAHAALKPDEAEFSPALAVGDLWLLLGLWQQLGMARALKRTLNRRRVRFDVEALVRVMVFNRLSDPTSKLGLLRWLETVYLPGIDRAKVTHQHLLRAMDVLCAHKEELEAAVGKLLLPLLDQDLSVVFYDLTTVRIHGAGEVEEDVRRFGHSKDVNGTARQFAVGVVQSAEGLPLAHEVFEGNVYEAATLEGMVQRLLERFPTLRRIVLVADRGLLNLDNLALLEAVQTPAGTALEYILAVPARRYSEYGALCAQIEQQRRSRPDAEANRQSVHESEDGEKRRVVVAHDPAQAQLQSRHRDETIAEIEALAARLAARLNAQDAGQPKRGRRSSDEGAFAQVRAAVQEAKLGRIIHTDIDDGRFLCVIDDQALERARQFDGKLILVTNVRDLSAERIVQRYKSLADIERGFRVLKSEIEIAPVYHRLPERIRAHAFICFLALVLHRVMRMRLKQAGSELSPARAIALAQRIQYHRVTIRHREMDGVGKLTPEQKELFDQLAVERPTTEAIKTAA
jgi:transposase